MTFTGCTKNPDTINAPKVQSTPYIKPTASKAPLFQKTMIKVALSTKEDADYRKIAFDTPEKKAWFRTLMYRLWDRQITRRHFIDEGISKYPTHHYEFYFVAKGFQNNS